MSIKIPVNALVFANEIIVNHAGRDITIDGIPIPWHISPKIEISMGVNEEPTVWIGIPANKVTVKLTNE